MYCVDYLSAGALIREGSMLSSGSLSSSRIISSLFRDIRVYHSPCLITFAHMSNNSTKITVLKDANICKNATVEDQIIIVA